MISKGLGVPILYLYSGLCFIGSLNIRRENFVVSDAVSRGYVCTKSLTMETLRVYGEIVTAIVLD